MSILSVMTFNVRGAYYDDGINSWENRRDLSVETILRYSADIIAFQEIHTQNLDVYRARMNNYEYILGPYYNDTAPHQYLVLFWKPHRLRLIANGGFWLSHTPNIHSRAWNTGCIRAAMWTRLQYGPTGQTLLQVNTHLDHMSELARVEGTKLIVKQIGKLVRPNEPIILTGDFNCSPGSEAYQIFTTNGFIDTFTATGHKGVERTYHSFLGDKHIPSKRDHDRIDWVLLRDTSKNLTAVDYLAVKDANLPIYPSDHYPVLVNLRIE